MCEILRAPAGAPVRDAAGTPNACEYGLHVELLHGRCDAFASNTQRMSALVRIQDVSKTYRAGAGSTTFALDSVSIDVPEGEFIALLGPSGCGKTTLLNMIAGFEHPDRGTVHVGSTLVKRPGRERGYVFQEDSLFPWMTVRENVALGLIAGRGGTRASRNDVVMHYLNMVDLTEFAGAFPHQLSGGMKQRAAIARALAPDPAVLLMDEPFAALDAQTRYQMQLELLKICERAEKTVVFVTHSIEEAVVLADRIVLLSPRPGRVVLDEPVSLQHPRPMHEPRAVELVRRLHAALFEGEVTAS
jgi:NitT/TauT family transport system ATP-binding protein